jgi:hypothetical protein
MQRRHILGGALTCAVVVAGIGVVAYALHRDAYPGLHAPVSVLCPGPPDPVADQGAPAIRPHSDCTPAFTAQEVREYAAHGLSLGKIAVAGQVSVTRVVFLTIADLGGASGDTEWAANYPAGVLVCYVALRGTFRVFAPGPSLGAPNSSPAAFSVAFVLFDGHTGNELVMGTGAPLG